MATLQIILKTHRKRNDGTYPVCFQLTIQRKARYLYTGIHVLESQFKKGDGSWIRKHTDAILLNRNLELKRRQLMTNLLEAQGGLLPMTHEAIFEGKERGTTIGALLKQKADYFEKKNSKRWFYKMMALKKDVEECFGHDMQLSEIDTEAVNKIGLYYEGKGNNLNTIAGKIKIFRDLIGAEIKTGKYHGINHFALVKFKGQEVKKERLTYEDIKKMEALELGGDAKITRDMFLFSFYAQGMRLENCLLFKKENAKKMIEYRMNKGRKNREIEIVPQLKKIIEHYIDTPGPYLFPYVKSEPENKWNWQDFKDRLNVKINRELKKVCLQAGISKKVSFHVARHSFASLMKKFQHDNGISDIFLIQKALGHSDIKTTQMYLDSLDDDDVNEQVAKIFEG